jgi:hypothetical protein
VTLRQPTTAARRSLALCVALRYEDNWAKPWMFVPGSEAYLTVKGKGVVEHEAFD